jgi:plasmid maintenance system antidote protein VapI
MTVSTALITTNHLPQHEEDMFSDLEPISAFDVKKDYVATQLAALMSFCGKNRSEIALGLGWKKSRVTKVLSGKENLTLKSVLEFSSYLGFDFDVVFHGTNEQRPKQPWQIEQRKVNSVTTASTQLVDEYLQWIPSSLVINIQQAHEVANDLLTGNHRNIYISIDVPPENSGNTVMLGNQTQTNQFSTWLNAPQRIID